jgi:hypothetical protein
MPRKRLSDEVKKIRNTYQPCRSLQAGASAGPLEAVPAYLNQGERGVWLELVSHAPEGVLTRADETILATACRLENEYREKGSDMPASKIGLLLKCLGKLGLNPADRASVPAPKPEAPNPFDVF